MSEPPAEVTRRVEGASLEQLGSVDIDEVYVQMDHLLESRPTSLDLYKRWESQNWKTQDLDLSEDKLHWDNMAGVFEGIRLELQRTMTLFFIGEQAVTDTLSPLVHAAPDEPARIFLSTQLVDEARHSVFFSKFFEEVVGVPGGLGPALADLRGRVIADAYRKIFDEHLVGATEEVRLNPRDYGAWVEAITIYHLIVEGMLALTGQKFLLRIIREMGILPGFYTGFTAVARDESRHVNFGVRALLEAGVRDRSLLERVESVVFRLLESAVWTVVGPERKFEFSYDETPPNLQINPYEVASFSLHSLTKRLRTAGISADTCAEIERRGHAYYDAAWNHYEVLHGEEHPRRFIDRLATTAS